MKAWCFLILAAIASAVLSVLIAKSLGVQNTSGIAGGVAGAVSAVIAVKLFSKQKK